MTVLYNWCIYIFVASFAATTYGIGAWYLARIADKKDPKA